jgi:diketogulonate reductase-like aldo/keto reductase
MVFAAFLLSVTLVVTRSDTSSSPPSGVRALSREDSPQKSMHLIYGTAWKKDDTARLVTEAIRTGFRHIDTACQPKHYNEKGVGDGWTAAAEELGLSRRDISLQTKFTPVSGQDPNNIPYDKTKPIAEQARESLEVSLKNLQTDYLDSWVLHSPPESFEDLMDVWRVMEEAITQRKVLKIGISNCYDMDTFRLLYQQAEHKPSVSSAKREAKRKTKPNWSHRVGCWLEVTAARWW